MTLSLRSYTPDDLPTLAALRKGRPPSPYDIAALRRELAQPNLIPERDCILAFDNDAPVGCAYLTREPAIARGVLEITLSAGNHPESPAGDALLAETISRARRDNLALLHIDVPEADESQRRALSNRGWRRVREHLRLTRDLPQRVHDPLPPRASLRPAARRDAPTIARVQNAAFTGSWGYAPNTPQEIEYRIFDLPALPPDPVILLEENNHLIAYCWCHRQEATARGLVGMVGVLPSRQGQGLGRAVVAAGVNALLDLEASPIDITVDSQNPPAIRVYESVGFLLASRSLWFELTL